MGDKGMSDALVVELASAVVMGDWWAWRQLSGEIRRRMSDRAGDALLERLLQRLSMDGFHRLELLLRACDQLPWVPITEWLAVVARRLTYPDDPPEHPVWCGPYEVLLAVARRHVLAGDQARALAKHLGNCEACTRVAFDHSRDSSERISMVW
jgi:hypothetical protein